MAAGAEHDEAVAAARAHIGGLDRQPLAPLPGAFAAGRRELHRIAEEVLKPRRIAETGNEIALCFSPGGFGTPAWEDGARSGGPGSLRVEGSQLVETSGSGEQRTPIDVGEQEVAALADWFAFGTVALAEVIDRADGPAASTPEPIRLWPEHFDVATVIGAEEAGARANYGASPGDDDHAEPYLYVGPWSAPASGPLWNAVSFPGAELGYAALLEADDQVEAAVTWMLQRVRALG